MILSPILRKLHWLPIEQRIKLKIADLTYKTLPYKEPSYLPNLLIPLNSPRILRSSNTNLLSVFHKICPWSAFFSFAAPTVWNNLPQSLCMSPTAPSFHDNLKTFVYQP